MMRTPLRPIARILDAREKGENPDVIEAEERAIHNVKLQTRMRRRAESRSSPTAPASAAAAPARSGCLTMTR